MRRIAAAFNARDLDALLAFSDPNIESHSTFSAVGGAVYHGHDGVRQWHEELREVFAEDVSVDPEAYFDLDDAVLAFMVLRGRGRASGVDVELPIAQVHRFRDGLDVSWKSYVDRGEALKELGVALDELEAIAP